MNRHAHFIAIFAAIFAASGCKDVLSRDRAVGVHIAMSGPAAQGASGNVAPGAPLLARTAREAIVVHAPFKQVNAEDGTPNREIGRTPAAACDAMLFLDAWAAAYPEDAEASRRRDELAAWVLGLQDRAREAYGITSVPSTPDLAPPLDRFYYSIDATLCGRAMLALHRRTGAPEWLHSAEGFGDTLVALAGRQAEVFVGTGFDGGFCAYVTPVGEQLAYDCNSHVKDLLAIGFLRDLAETTGRGVFAETALAARRFLLPGLAGGWEYADAQAALRCAGPCAPVWRRVPGPWGEPDRFVYGDSVAYALAGLHAHDGPTQEVARLYRAFQRYRGTVAETRAYRGEIAFAGYLDVPARAPDRHSGYYDLVTMGILGPLRRDVAPAHDAAARAFMQDRLLATGDVIRWGAGFDGQRIGIDYLDLTTLATLGLWALGTDWTVMHP